MTTVFVYGTLLDDRVAKLIVGRVPKCTTAILRDYIRLRVKGEAFPAIVPQDGASVQGRVFTEVSEKEVELLDDYEGIALDKADYATSQYKRTPVTVTLGDDGDGGSVTAQAYVWGPAFRSELESAEWDLNYFMKHDFAAFMDAELS